MNSPSPLHRCIALGLVALLLGCSPNEDTPKATETQTPAGENSPQSPSSPSTPSPNGSVTPSQQPQSPDTLALKLSKIESMIAGQQLEPAWEGVKSLIVEYPNEPSVLFVAARVMALRKNLSGAIQMISKIDPKAPDAGLAATGQLAEWLAQTGNLPEAEAKAKIVLSSAPSAIPALRLMVDIYHAQGRHWEAGKVIERLIRLGNFSTPDLMHSIDTREPVEVEPLRQSAKKFAPEDPYNRLADLRMMTGANRWSDAAAGLKQLHDQHPLLLEPWIWYGESLIETNQWDQLPAWALARPAGHEIHPEYWYIVGRMHEQQRDFPTAARAYAESLRRDRRHLPSMQALAVCLTEMGDLANAKEVRNEAAKLVRIKDLSLQIQRGSGKRNEYVAVASLYRELGDPVGAFAWDTILLVNEKQPLTAELMDTQKKLKGGPKIESQILAKLPVSSWPEPADQAMAIAPPNDLEAISPASSSMIRFRDVASSMGIDMQYENGAEPNRGWTTIEGLGGGVSAMDMDRDGWPDLFFSQAGDNPIQPSPKFLPKRLYRSRSGRSFVDVAANAYVASLGFGQGTGIADIDQDGFDDLLVAEIGGIRHFRNQGDGTFESVPIPQAPPPAYWNSSIQAADLNGDSLPDIVQGEYIHGTDVFTRRCATTQNSQLIFCHPKRFEPGKSRILFSDGEGQWQLAPEALLSTLVDGYALGTLITDIDGRGGNDVYFANDVSPNHLLLSEGEGTQPQLHETGMAAGVAVDALGRAQASMGMACGDQNRDGMLDLIVTNFRYEDSTLYLQVSPGIFVDGTRTSRLGDATREWLSFGCQLSDLDNDGWLDFITVNGHIDKLTPWQMPPQVLHNRKGRFEWLRTPSPGPYFDVDNVGRSLTQIDFDRNGKLDFAITHLDRPVALLANETEAGTHHFLQLELIGTRSQREAIGALVRVRGAQESWVAPLSVGDGYYGTNERIIHIGLGTTQAIDAIEIVWPSGDREEFAQVAVDRRYRIIESIGMEPCE